MRLLVLSPPREELRNSSLAHYLSLMVERFGGPGSGFMWRAGRLDMDAVVAAMRAVFARVLAEGGIAGVEDSIASVSEIFSLQGDARMRELNHRFRRKNYATDVLSFPASAQPPASSPRQTPTAVGIASFRRQ